MYNCNQCNKTFNSTKSLGGHMAMMIKRGKHIKKEKEKISKIKNEWLQENGKYKCPYCDKEYSKNGICFHIWRIHGEGINHNPNLNTSNQQVWNKGLTKENDKRIKKQGETFKKNLALGLFLPNQQGKPHKQETKDKISKSRIKYLNENPDKIPYLLNHSSKKSYPEQTFEKYLNLYNIKGWIYNYSVNRFCLDFVFPEWKLDVEIDGATHNLKDVKRKDLIRDNFLKEQGWHILRFTAKEVKENIYECINKILNIISKDKLIEIPKEFLNKKYEKEEKHRILLFNKEQKKKDKETLEKLRYQIIVNTIKENGINRKLLGILCKKLNISHTSVNRLCKKLNISYK